MGLPDHLNCLLRNLYAGQEATVRTGHGMTDWFEIGKGVRQGCILSPCLFNLYAEYIRRNAGSQCWKERIGSQPFLQGNRCLLLPGSVCLILCFLLCTFQLRLLFSSRLTQLPSPLPVFPPLLTFAPQTSCQGLSPWLGSFFPPHYSPYSQWWVTTRSWVGAERKERVVQSVGAPRSFSGSIPGSCDEAQGGGGEGQPFSWDTSWAPCS